MPQIYHNLDPLAQMPASYPASRVTHESVSVTADGVKTYETILNEIFSLIDNSKVTPESYFVYQAQIYRVADISTSGNRYIFIRSYFDAVSGKSQCWQLEILASSSKLVQQNGDGNIVNYSSSPPNVGDKFTLSY